MSLRFQTSLNHSKPSDASSEKLKVYHTEDGKTALEVAWVRESWPHSLPALPRSRSKALSWLSFLLLVFVCFVHFFFCFLLKGGYKGGGSGYKRTEKGVGLGCMM